MYNLTIGINYFRDKKNTEFIQILSKKKTENILQREFIILKNFIIDFFEVHSKLIQNSLLSILLIFRTC